MRISSFLKANVWLVGQFICLQTAAAQILVEQKSEGKSGLHPALSTTYVRSAADKHSADYRSILAARVNTGYTFADRSKLSVSTGFSHDLDALEERNVWSNTTLSYSSHGMELREGLSASYSASVIAPTNSDMRHYLSYRGSAVLAANLTQTWMSLPLIKDFSFGAALNGSRNFFEYDASKAGNPNTMIELSPAINAAMTVNNIVSLSANYALSKARKSNGTWKDTTYRHDVSASASLNDQLSLTLSESNENRAYSYDAETAKFALYDFQTTVYSLTATYTF
jgi:hypothetical protein